MDKRFLLALVLTAVVVVATPWLFGTQSSRVSKTERDTALASDTTAAVRPSPQETPIAQPTVAPARDSSLTSIQARPETTTVSLKLADYTFSSRGAAPISVGLSSYKALDGSNRSVTLRSKS